MLQGSDPFDEFRKKKEIERLENRFFEGAQEKRRRLKELLEEDSTDPDQVERRVQEEMESFFRESTTAAEAVFTEVGVVTETGRGEIQSRIDEVLRPVEATGESRPSEPARPPSEEEELQAALARLRGDPVERPGRTSDSSSEATPSWLDVTEERIEEPAVAAETEDDEARRRRLLGAFDESFDRLQGLLRDGFGERTPGEDIEEIIEEVIEEEIDPGDEPPLARRTDPGGFSAISAEPAPESVPVREDPSVHLGLEARVDALEREVSRLWSILHRSGLAEDEAG